MNDTEIVVSITNKADFNEAMELLDYFGYSWSSGTRCTAWTPFCLRKDDINIIIYLYISKENKEITYEKSTFISTKAITFQTLKNLFLGERKNFIKEDLIDGMVAKMSSDGDYYIYFKRFGKFIGNNGFLWLRDYNVDLTHKKGDLFDIIAIYRLTDLTHLDDLKDSIEVYGRGELIWERKPEETLMTIAEIEEKLGIKNLKIVKEIIKNDNDNDDGDDNFQF